MQDRLPTKRKNKPLTQKQKRFVTEYLVDLNATQAAVRSGYSRQSAKKIAYDLVRKPHVRAAIKDKLRYLEKKNEASIQRTLAELKAIAYLDPRDIVEWGPTYVTLRESVDLPPEIAGAVQAVELTKDGVKIKFWNKLEALEKLGKYHHMWHAPTKDDDGRAGKAPIHFTLKIGDSLFPPRRQEVPEELQAPPGRSIDFTQPAQLPKRSKLAPEVTEFIEEIADDIEDDVEDE